MFVVAAVYGPHINLVKGLCIQVIYYFEFDGKICEYGILQYIVPIVGFKKMYC